MKKKPTNPRPKMAKFVLTTWAACLARQKPVSTRAKPACMKTTRTAPITIHSRLTCVPRSVTASSGSASWAPAGATIHSEASRATAVATRTLGRRHSGRGGCARDEPLDRRRR